MNASVARLRYHGTGGALLGLVFVNALLTIVTLGIYSFWAKNKVREFHYSHTEMDGDRFAYHGTGGELFKGALKAFGFLFALIVVFTIVNVLIGRLGLVSPDVAAIVMTAVLYAVIAILVVVAVHLARRYRMSRSSLRGIRFSYHGALGEFVRLMVRGTLLTIVTLGFYAPYFQNQRRAFLVKSVRFGSEPFMYNADGKELFGQYVKALLLTIPTLGFSWTWYLAFAHRYMWGNTTMRGARFRSSVTGGELLKVQLVNLALVIFTLGIGTTWALTRMQAFWCENLALHGTVDWATIEQRAQIAGAVGEGLADGLDVDVGIGI